MNRLMLSIYRMGRRVAFRQTRDHSVTLPATIQVGDHLRAETMGDVVAPSGWEKVGTEEGWTVWEKLVTGEESDSTTFAASGDGEQECRRVQLHDERPSVAGCLYPRTLRRPRSARGNAGEKESQMVIVSWWSRHHHRLRSSVENLAEGSTFVESNERGVSCSYRRMSDLPSRSEGGKNDRNGFLPTGNSSNYL